jgi:hypothetical protein
MVRVHPEPPVFDKPKTIEIKYMQAPCQPDGWISSEGQQESRDGTCYCSIMPEGCCVSGEFSIILPKRLKPEYVRVEAEVS